ncbi:MAG: dehydrogenase subunit [Verrucomicrobiales bacterium]|nr:dehydrogenase subunit [Verrucomicrobiales bacterium]
MNHSLLLTVLTFLPVLGAALLLGMDGEDKKMSRRFSIGFSLLPLICLGLIWRQFDSGMQGLQFVERHAWIPSLGVEYFVGIDGLGFLMLLLSAIVVPFALVATPKEIANPRLYFALFLFLQTGLFGTFTALNFFHWFIFWEISLIPAFFLIKLWGGPQRTKAAYQFFVYTMLGSVTLLLAFLALFAATGTLDFIRLSELTHSGELVSAIGAKLTWSKLSPNGLVMLIFFGALLGFAVKVPLIPFHTWLPTAYTEAPSSTSMVLTGVMSKMGVYGFLRILLPIFPEQLRAVLTPLLWLAVATIVLSAYAAFAQKDLKRIVAYSSINHLGYCLLGLFAAVKFSSPGLINEKAAALNGVILQMFNHGVTASALFCFVGFIEQRSGGLRGLNDFGGLRKLAPVFCGLMGITVFSSLGLPGLNGFVGEFLIFKGTFSLAAWAASLSTIGLLVTAIFLLTMLQRVFTGPVNKRWSTWTDLTTAERLTVLPMIAIMFVVGIFPQVLLSFINPTVMQIIQQFK